MNDSFGFLALASRIKTILQDVRSLDERIRALEGYVSIGTDPYVDASGMSNILSPHLVYPCQITGVSGDQADAIILKTNPVPGGSPKLIADTDLGTLTLTIASTTDIPTIGDIVAGVYIGEQDGDIDADPVYALLGVPSALSVTGVASTSTLTVVTTITYYPTYLLEFDQGCFTVVSSETGVATITMKGGPGVTTEITVLSGNPRCLSTSAIFPRRILGFECGVLVKNDVISSKIISVCCPL